MKKIYTLLLLVMSLVLMGQSWEYDSNGNPFNNSNRRPYEDLAKKKEQEINRDMGYVKRIITQSGNIYEQLKENNYNKNEQQNATGPGAPGEPVPIDDQIMILFIAAIAILIFYKKHLQKLNITNHKN